MADMKKKTEGKSISITWKNTFPIKIDEYQSFDGIYSRQLSSLCYLWTFSH